MELISAELKKHKKNAYIMSLHFKLQTQSGMAMLDIPMVQLPIELPLDEIKYEDIDVQKPSIILSNGIELPILCDTEGIGIKTTQNTKSFVKYDGVEDSIGESDSEFKIRYLESKILSLLKEHNFTFEECKKLTNNLDVKIHCQKNLFKENKQ